MISARQLEANRRNAQQSTGPRTAEGKARSSRNSLRHALTGQISLLSTDDREAYESFCARFIDHFKPETALERQLAQSIAEDHWRLNRVCAIENNIFALGHVDERREIQIALADARTFRDHAAQFSLLTLYEQRIHRNLHRNLKLLSDLQAERKSAREQAMAEARLLAQVNLINGLAYNPAQDGFEFSNLEINRAIDRANRLQSAKEAEQPLQNPASRLKYAGALAA